MQILLAFKARSFDARHLTETQGKIRKRVLLATKCRLFFLVFGVPADKIVSGFDFPGGRAPTQTGNGPISDKGDVLKMIADDLAIAEVMVLVDQRVVEWFEFCVSDRFEINKAEIRQCFL